METKEIDIEMVPRNSLSEDSRSSGSGMETEETNFGAGLANSSPDDQDRNDKETVDINARDKYNYTALHNCTKSNTGSHIKSIPTRRLSGFLSAMVLKLE